MNEAAQLRELAQRIQEKMGETYQALDAINEYARTIENEINAAEDEIEDRKQGRR